MAKRYALSDSKWERIAHLFPTARTDRPVKWDHQTIFHAILWLTRSGLAWEDTLTDTLHIKVCTAVFVSGVMMGV